ncbi:putative undecaprenyl diphosphate synthase-domain-containing protein [Fusarium flagelliforme]|uniref:Undecaprenyl diphosphate synthase n=1 Tax=Fusarium flagelliforme TaxID=2675880 RepID=A0A395MX23_9HYPO|nr:putative undecaprenyl diphosphate synthase-domain-containing protein [Fusarium flagelliforme]KAH7198895.1 putative undecaprenyl diphosphate synthase-domain-containing protein [Fusarium flagelliforme]RFN51769.1 undecaprenyl diphosphate synthase [Fusarium flagelliforme]
MTMNTALLFVYLIVTIHAIVTLARWVRSFRAKWRNFYPKRLIWRNKYVSFEEFHAAFDRGDIMFAATLAAATLQLSHPKISKVLQAHSTYKSDYWRRVIRTVAFMYTIVRANSSERQQVIAWLQNLHRPVSIFTFENNVMIFATFAYALVNTHRFLRDVAEDEADAIASGVMSMADKLDPKDLGREYPKTMEDVEKFLEETLSFGKAELLTIHSESSELGGIWKEIKRQGVRRSLRKPFTLLRWGIFNLFVFRLSKRVLAGSPRNCNTIERGVWWMIRNLNILFSTFHYSLCPRALTFDGTMDLLLTGSPRMENILTELHSEIFGSKVGHRITSDLQSHTDLEAHLPSMDIDQRALPEMPGFREDVRELINCAYYRGELADAISKPQHLGIIMDGNRRYSRSHGLGSVLLGHQAGAHKLIQVMSWVFSSGISNLTVWALSNDNLKRGPGELNPLFKMMAEYIQEVVLNDAPFSIPAVRFRVVGDRSILPEHLQGIITEAEAATRHNTKFNLQLALGYGGRSETILATRLAVAARVERTGLPSSEVLESITEAEISNQIYSSRLGLPKIDAILRTSGENRLSGFALWESQHAEFAIIKVNWPALRQSVFLRALLNLSKRNRRLGA